MSSELDSTAIDILQISPNVHIKFINNHASNTINIDYGMVKDWHYTNCVTKHYTVYCPRFLPLSRRELDFGIPHSQATVT